ncbi:MAG TPA: class I SAM-dependent methyltransferase, partial [Sphingomicrobium sp.]
MGGNALNSAIASTSKWDAGDYARVGSFVPALGLAAVNLLDPRPGERILDVGCGDGALSLKIIERGAEVVGVDSSAELIEVARAAGVYAELTDAADMAFERQFDAAFSNAALHWMLDKARVAAAVFNALH